jgi:hypothetical protein
MNLTQHSFATLRVKIEPTPVVIMSNLSSV